MDPIQFGKQIGALVREQIAKALVSVADRVTAIEQKVATWPTPKDGASVTVDDVRPLIEEEVAKATAAIRIPEDGKSVSADDVLPTLRQELQAAVEAIPPAVDGKSVTLEDVRPLIEEAVKAIPAPKAGENGTSVTVGEVLPALQAQVKSFLDGLTPPADGKSVTLAEVLDALAPVLENLHAKWALDFERRAQETLQRSAERIPKPKDGENGADGLGFDDMVETVEDGGRFVVRRYTRGELTKEFRYQTAAPVYRGVFGDKTYLPGDLVTWAGSLWHANVETKNKPGEGNADWTLAAKRGRDGKDAAIKAGGPPTTVKLS